MERNLRKKQKNSRDVVYVSAPRHALIILFVCFFFLEYLSHISVRYKTSIQSLCIQHIIYIMST